MNVRLKMWLNFEAVVCFLLHLVAEVVTFSGDFSVFNQRRRLYLDIGFVFTW